MASVQYFHKSQHNLTSKLDDLIIIATVSNKSVSQLNWLEMAAMLKRDDYTSQIYHKCKEL